jgi:hypothetical protein
MNANNKRGDDNYFFLLFLIKKYFWEIVEKITIASSSLMFLFRLKSNIA